MKQQDVVSTTFVLRTVNSLGWSATMPFFAIYLDVVRRLALGSIGVVYLASGFATFLSQILGGHLTDRFGAKRVMLTGYACSFISSSLTGYLIFTKSPVYILVTLYPVFSLFRGFSNPATSSLIASLKERAKMSKGFSLLTMGGNLGFGFGPAVGGYLADSLGYAYVFVFSSFCALFATFFALYRVRDVPKIEFFEQKKGANHLSLFVVVFLSFFVNGYTYTTLSLYAASYVHLTNSQIGLLFTTNGLEIVLLQLPLMKLIDKSLFLSPSIAMLLTSLAYLVVAFSHNFFELELAVVVSTLGEILLAVPMQTIVAQLSKEGNRGRYQGYYFSSSSLGRSLSSFVGPSSMQFFEPFYAWCAVAAFSALLCFVHHKQKDIRKFS